ncbi:MAG: HEPN domain-containing protein [Patescibacteria group bacterium]
MNTSDLLKSLLSKASKDIQTAEDLFKLKHFDWALFIWHLAIEKVLKAKILSVGTEVIYTHKLARLAELTSMSFTVEEKEQLNEITTFNIEARYDDYKLTFYKKATLEYSQKWIVICKHLYNKVISSL